MRILLFTGKGGVGKTTLAAATAARLAADGRKPLVVSTDPAHSLADAFGTGLGPDPSEVDAGLYASHVDARVLVDRSWRDLRDAARSVLRDAGLDEIDAEELTVLPGVDELLALTEVARYAAGGPWDVLVVDCGPTAETLRLLALPEAVHRYVDGAARRTAPPGTAPPSAPRVPSPAAAAALRRLATHLGQLRTLLTDPRRSSVRLVLTPERMVVAETRRTLSVLALRGVQVDCLVANRLVPRARRWHGPAAGWLRARRTEQDAVLAELATSSPLRIRPVEHRATEPIGVPALLELADELYAGLDPLDGLTAPTVPLLRVEPGPGGYRLAVALPISDSTVLDLARIGDDLAVTVDGERRIIALPAMLRRYPVIGADADTDGIVVRFGPDPA